MILGINAGIAYFWVVGVLMAALSIFMIRRMRLAKKIYLSKRHLESTFDSIEDPLAIVSTDYTINRVNRAYADLVGKRFPDILKHKCYEVLRGRTSPCKDCKLERVLKTGAKQYTPTSPHPVEPKFRTISFTFYPFSPKDKEVPSVVEHIRDITELEYLKTNLERQNRTLSDTTKILRRAQEEIQDELNLARQVQMSTLPEDVPTFGGLKIDVRYFPVEAVGGDVYDFIAFSDTKLGIFIGDASGHGLPSAFISTISKMSLYSHSKKEMASVRLLERLNRDLIGNIRTSHYLTCVWGIFDANENSLTYVRAGHPMPIVIRKNGDICQLNAAGTFAGILDEPVYEQKKFYFQKGDRCYLCTDGIYEVMDKESPKPGVLGYKRFTEIVASTKDLPFMEVLPTIEKTLSGFKYDDDYTIIVLEITEDRNPDLSEDLPGFTETDDISYTTFSNYHEASRYFEIALNQMTRAGFESAEVQRMKLCINELVSNALEHGNGNDTTKSATLAYSVSPEEMKFCVVDEGSGFTPSEVPDPTNGENIGKEGGRGLYLIRNYADEFVQNSRGNGVFIRKANAVRAAF